MNGKVNLVKKDNSLIQASYELTRLEQCCILFCLTQISTGDEELADFYKIRAVEFAEMFGIDKDRSYRELQNIVHLLYERSVSIPLENGKRLKSRWVSGIRYDDGNGELQITIAKDIKPYILQLRDEFTAYDIRNIAGFSSKYSIRVYELVIRWKNSNIKKINASIIEFREILQLSDKYVRINDLTKFVIEPAISDINKFSNISISYTLKKRGRKFVSIDFSFKEKTTKDQANLEKKQGKLSLDASAPSKKPDKMPRRFVDRFAPVGWSYEDCYASESLKQKWAECKDWIAYVK